MMNAKDVRAFIVQSIIMGEKVIIRRYGHIAGEFGYTVSGSRVRRDVGDRLWNEARGEIINSNGLYDAKERAY